MAASTSDLLTDTENGGPPEPTTASATRDPDATTLECEALTNWPTDTKVFFVTGTPTTDAEGSPIINPTTLMLWSGIVSGTNLVDLVLTGSPGDADLGNNIGDLVQMAPTSTFFHALYTALTKDHDTQGRHSNLHDTNNNLWLGQVATASAVNYVQAANAATGNGPTISAVGSDTNINLGLAAKGTGFIKSTPPVWQYLGYAQITSSATTTATSATYITGLYVTATIPTGATKVKITVYSPTFYASATPKTGYVYIYSGASAGTLTTELQSANSITNTTAGYGYSVHCMAIIPAVAGALTFSAAFASDSGGGVTATFGASSISPAYILVECC